MMLLGDRLPAARAVEWSLINWVTTEEALEETALDFAHKLAAGLTRSLA